MTIGINLVVAQPAHAENISCKWPRCTVYLNRKETNSWAYWGIIPQISVGALGTAWYAASMTQRWFVIQYANRGQCVGFNLSLAPWESQGLFGYRC